MPYYSSTFGCFSDTAVCMDTFFCPCCQVGRQCAALRGEADTHDCGNCLLSVICAWAMPMCLRCKVSDKFELGEAAVVSCVCGMFCSACSVCMTGRELNFRGSNPGGCCCKPADSTHQLS